MTQINLFQKLFHEDSFIVGGWREAKFMCIVSFMIFFLSIVFICSGIAIMTQAPEQIVHKLDRAIDEWNWYNKRDFQLIQNIGVQSNATKNSFVVSSTYQSEVNIPADRYQGFHYADWDIYLWDEHTLHANSLLSLEFNERGSIIGNYTFKPLLNVTHDISQERCEDNYFRNLKWINGTCIGQYQVASICLKLKSLGSWELSKEYGGYGCGNLDYGDARHDPYVEDYVLDTWHPVVYHRAPMVSDPVPSSVTLEFRAETDPYVVGMRLHQGKLKSLRNMMPDTSKYFGPGGFLLGLGVLCWPVLVLTMMIIVVHKNFIKNHYQQLKA
eukprot:gb/GECH01010598.1/.p1 GENE.gb/GECH01010598.1/~~gb/GECH01010598.1/.p1  ORF type:complete len:327 (+),score=48.52 gb/GECH01010598.1/:1-981(+)